MRCAPAACAVVAGPVKTGYKSGYDQRLSSHAVKWPFKSSFWGGPHQSEPSYSWSGDAVADVAIAGGGYAGMSSAYYLKKAKPDLDIAIVESMYSGFGPSGRNFGFVSPGVREIRGGLGEKEDIGEQRAVTSYYLRMRRELERRMAESSIECDYQTEHLLEQALDEASWEGLQRTSAYLTAKGTPHVLVDRAHLATAAPFPYEVRGGLVRTAWRTLQPYKLARGLRQQLLGMGVRFLQGAPVTALESTESGAPVLRCGNGASIKARHAVFATNAYSRFLPFLDGLIFPRHTYVLATEPLSTEQLAPLGFHDYKAVNDAGFVFYYARVYRNQLLFGGGANTQGLFVESTVDTAADQKVAEYERIHREMLSRWPTLADTAIDAAWAGPIDGTPNFVPLVKPLDGWPNVVINIGYNGEGIVPANSSGLMTLGLVLGKSHFHAEAEQIRQIFLRPK
jgi:gamma-glutamylputrescine oxidase